MENSWLDIQHRGFRVYVGETADAGACVKFNRAIASASRSGENVNTVFLDCAVKTDWIERIETALPFVENAVRENRQFILRQGETVPTQKAKRVSKASVEHLSRHSELITTLPDPGEDLIPDKIYMTENVGTFTVYENRFLYMLLSYLRDFVGFRYQRITELAASFSSDISLNKEFAEGTRKISYSLTYSETAQGIDGTCNSKTGEAVARIRSILQAVELLLRTDLMREVSTAPMLKPPIARTNVLLHDPNFKAAFELYDFLTAYTEPGFEKIERYRAAGSFTDEMRADFAALIAMTSYLSYRCGGLYDELEERFAAEEKRRKEEAEKAKKEKLAALKANLGEISGAAFDYIQALEQRVAELEGREERLHEAERLRTEAEARLEDAAAQIKQLQSETSKLGAAIRERFEENQRLSEAHAQAMNAAQQRVQEAEAQREEAQRRFAAEFEQQKQDFLKEYEALAEQYRLLNARNHALAERQGNPLSEEPHYTKESFAELEAEYEAFKRFFDRQWKIAKKQIRKEQLWKK